MKRRPAHARAARTPRALLLRRCALGATLLMLAGAHPGCARRPAPAAWAWHETRESYLRRSAVWLGDDLHAWVAHMRTLDLAAGPRGAGAFAVEELVRCTYVEPADATTWSGNTPKFLCRQHPDEPPFKVKWGEGNGEIFADLAASRLFWALGFPTDAIYPVEVECTGCADDPWRDRKLHPGHVPPVFAPAIVEHQLEGRTIEEFPHQGWTWRELDSVDPSVGGAPRAQVDALRMLAAFVQHRDSKADNQRLLCLPSPSVSPDAAGSCRRPVLMIDDLGSALGGPGHFKRTHKMRLKDWARRPVWKDARHCIANLTRERDAKDGLYFPQIGDAGRRFLATLLGALDDVQVRALFTVARADRRGDLPDWMVAFKRRREQVKHPVPSDPRFRCPTE